MILATTKGIENLIRQFAEYMESRLTQDDRGYIIIDVAEIARDFIEQMESGDDKPTDN